jgi:uncharacterized heparinase superfamily protein
MAGRDLPRLLRTARYLRAGQVLHRLRRRVFRPVPHATTAAWREPSRPWTPGVPKQRCLYDGQFVCLNVARDVRAATAWALPDADALWRYHLHYFDDLCADDAGLRATLLAAWIERWIAENPPGTQPGWEPYPLSRRIVNWCKWRLAGNELSPAALASLAMQVDLLAQSPEYDLLGNHLLANAKALVFAGLTLESQGSGRWLRQGFEILRRELPEQVLADGGHYERSPMYHAAALEDLLDLMNICAAYGAEPPPLTQLCAAMLQWLRCMTHPDGLIAQFNDAALDGAPSLAELEHYARALGVRADAGKEGATTLLQDSGYIRVQTPRVVALLDVGPIGPDVQPGHAHADSLSFELSLDGTRLFVDSGTSTYADNAERRWQRSTAAHNTVELDGEDSSEVWGAFRVGRRALPVEVTLRETVDGCIVSAAHDGYAPTLHRRTWTFSTHALAILDRFEGSGVTRAQWSLYVHPDADIELVPGRCRVVAPSLAGAVEIDLDPSLQWRVEAASWHPRFGVALPTRRLVASGELRLPASITVRLSW